MSVGIHVSNSRGVLLDNVVIRGFEKGLYVQNSNFLINNCEFSQNKVGIEAIRSFGTISKSKFYDNIIDLMVNNSSVHVIDTIAKTIQKITSRGTTIEEINANWIAQLIINTRNHQKKKNLFKKLLEKAKYLGLFWTIYQILKELGVILL